MLMGLQQESRVACYTDAVVGSEGKDDGFRGVDDEMTILQLSSC